MNQASSHQKAGPPFRTVPAVFSTYLILLLEDGRIIERGTRDELMRPSGKYSDMVRRQTESHDQRGSCSTAR